MTLETEEESGSPSLFELLEMAKDVIKTPDFMLCLDSGAFTYDQMWITSSLRGSMKVDVKVESALQGYHSGEVGGIIPETFRVLRTILGRLDNGETGEVCEELRLPVTEAKQKEAEYMASVSGE